ncbi:MAG TPA: hypothetical protein VIH78_08705 [Terriglobales bacterium]
MPRNQIPKSLFALLLGIMFFVGCAALNPFCGTARPKPGLTSLEPNPATLTQVEKGLLLTVNGSTFIPIRICYGTERHCLPQS